MSKAVPPSFMQSAFQCPHCQTQVMHAWHVIYGKKSKINELLSPMPVVSNTSKFKYETAVAKASQRLIALKDTKGKPRPHTYDQCVSDVAEVFNLHVSTCPECQCSVVWVNGKTVFPDTSALVNPHPDLPEDIKKDFEEARLIVDRSPRGAAALLRLAVEKLCRVILEDSSIKLNDAIIKMMRMGLALEVQRALDAVRVIGNEAVHPGLLDLRDDRQTVIRLFHIVNHIVQRMITDAKVAKGLIEEIISVVPDTKREEIERRSGLIEARDKAAATESPPP